MTLVITAALALVIILNGVIALTSLVTRNKEQ